MDWGLSKVIREGSVVTALGASHTKTGHIVGTPHYMSPEQAEGQEVDHRSDIYALGAVMYELLTLRRPFDGSALEVLSAIVRDDPEAPGTHSPEVPAALESVCLAALTKDPEARPQSVDVLVTEVQTWLESEADKTKRHALAEAKALEGSAKLAEHRRLKEEIARLEAEAQVIRGQFEPWQPAGEKATLIAAEVAVEAARDRVVEVSSEVVSLLSEAIGFEDDNARAREQFADYYWDRFQEAERRYDRRTSDFYRRLIAKHDRGKYARQLKGDGSVTLTSDPAGAEVWLYELVEDGFVLAGRNERMLGTTPLDETSLAMGRYLIVLKKNGFRDTNYPVYIPRNRSWSGEVKLYTDAQIGEGFVYVPAGPSLQGGDPTVVRALPRAEPWLNDFFIAEHPVTMSEYLDFVNDLARTESLDAAKARSPRPEPAGPTYLLEDGTDQLKLPGVDPDGSTWEPEMPVLSISWNDAVAYCEWRSRVDGCRYRLPSEQEWEKAVRGVDGRFYPWGDRFDASLCNMGDSLRGDARPLPVTRFPTDVSIYGLRGAAGNVADWTSTEYSEGRWVVRGGAWDLTPINSRCSIRSWHPPHIVNSSDGLRLACSPAKADHL